MRTWAGLVLLASFVPGSAFAACDALVATAKTAQGDALVGAYRDLIACDAKIAEANFEPFMKGATDLDTLAALSVVSIDGKLFTPVWGMLEKIPDYEQRDMIAARVGASCSDHPQVVTFIQGGYFALRDVQFGQWDESLVSCKSDAIGKWLEELVVKPPQSSYDEKYNTVISAYVKRKHADALPALERASIDAANHGGPFGMLIEKMAAAVEPVEIGESVTPAHKAKLEASYVVVAGAVGPEQAALVADRLYSGGAPALAASLLPRIYPDRVQADGTLLYGVAAIEVCEKDVVVHWAAVSEPAKRWSILEDVIAPARAFKPKLKCVATTPWEVVSTGEPILSSADLAPWVAGVNKQWAEKGSTVQTKEEKAIILP